ncbi:glutathione S-transferase [Aliiroseovarius halocynthiae]|uniref:Glutathione S-transferase family protein n=1 Tax=Aliiroseovarius halocynthiae TaxID=985055 RepID=A0A545SYE2_9RHOB|nr:glutathione S-transferase family protein [Aliiroseovarius halocynthiae]TQV69984.1 glutathione S-transferase family protein [Aliiroseovarius halocynthiae]SMR70650.1 glutathione S-transferase [Aliiroseovarius halocynthiae]
MKLYSHPFSQHSRRVRMLCDELKLRPEIENVSLESGEHRSAEFLEKNPTGRVPVLEDDSMVLPESHAIMKYLASKYGGERFYAQDNTTRAQIDMWLDWNHTKLNPPVQTLVIQSMSKDGDPAQIEAAAHQSTDALEILERAMPIESGPDGSPTLADLSLVSTIALFEMVGQSLQGFPKVAKWYADIKARPSFANTAPTMDQ